MDTKNLFRTVDSRYGPTTFFANDTGAVSQSLQIYGEWAQNEITFMTALISKGATIVDVGAYIGTHALAFARFTGPDGKVISIEPQNESFALLERNVAENGLTNVQLEHAAAANYSGVLHGSPINIAEKGSYGSASLPRSKELALSVHEKEQNQENIRPIKALTIDSLKLNSCSLIKIDVEGFEDLVIAGARQTIEQLLPVVYAECNSVANGLRSFEIMRQLGYEVYLHVVKAFNEENYLGVSRNIFGAASETSLVGVMGTRNTSIRNMQPRQCELILRIESADDLVLGMLNKPQYVGEILEIGAAARTGGSIWIEEARLLRDARDQANDAAHLARLEAETSRAEKELALRNRVHAQLEAAASHAQMGAAMLQARFAREAADQAEASFAELSRRYDEISVSLGQTQSKLVRALVDIGKLEQTLGAANASLSWRITKPLRMIKRQVARLLPSSEQDSEKK